MTRLPDDREADELRDDEIAEVRAALGTSSLERVDRAIEEVERQVALEDMVLLVVAGFTEASRAFFEFLVELNQDTTTPPESGERKEEKS